MSFSTVTNFRDALDAKNYAPVPDDWQIAVGDVVGSTPAIAAGRYKDVNLAGAAVIAAIVNACGEDLPYAFGGDGSVVLVPPEKAVTTQQALCAVQSTGRGVLDLDLRCALVPVRAVRAAGRDVRLAYQDLGRGRRLAMISGGGIEQAEVMSKIGSDFVLAASNVATEPDLTGLSCRWQPLKTANGVMLSIIIRARQDAAALVPAYRDLYESVQKTTARDLCPVALSALKMRWPPRGVAFERAFGGETRKIMMQSFFQYVSTISGITIGGYDGQAYAASLPTHSDYRKFADSLRMVIDCSVDEANAIESILSESQQAGIIDFGIHRADAALLTCFVQTTNDAGHVHFVDGSNGGYAMAAQTLKDRLAAGASTASGSVVE